MHSVILTELGISVTADSGHRRSFPFRDAVSEYLAVKHRKSDAGALADFLSKLGGPLDTNDEALLAALSSTDAGLDIRMMKDAKIEEIQHEKPAILVEAGFASDEADAASRLRDFALELTSARIGEMTASPELHIVHAINTLDETDKMINIVGARLREWYGLHFPELEGIMEGMTGFARIVRLGRRDAISRDGLEAAGIADSKITMIEAVLQSSIGGDIGDENLATVQTLARQVLDMHDLRQRMEEHVIFQMEDIAPNIAAILGASVGARLLAKAGSLKRLASMPASTIQVLGAEKALFRAIKTGSNPPKHGLLFQHALVHAAPRWQRGKIARVIAAKTAIAARVDVYGGGLNKTLLEKLNIRAEEISTKYKDAPPPKPAPDHGRRGTGGRGRHEGRAKRRGAAGPKKRHGRPGRRFAKR